MAEPKEFAANHFFIEVTGAGLAEVDGLYVPSTAPPTKSESGTVPVLDTGTGKWRGIVLTGNLREAQRFRIPTVTSLGESVDSMDILRMT